MRRKIQIGDTVKFLPGNGPDYGFTSIDADKLRAAGVDLDGPLTVSALGSGWEEGLVGFKETENTLGDSAMVFAERLKVIARAGKKITAQGIFNHVVRFMVKQGRPSSDAPTPIRGGKCLYRGPDNTCCAAGCLLTDEEAAGLDDFGIAAWDYLVHGGKTPERFTEFKLLIQDLQTAHDCAAVEWFVPSFLVYARNVAKKHGLKMPSEFACSG